MHAQLADIAADPVWRPVIRAEAKRAASEMPDGPAMADRDVHEMLRQRITSRAGGSERRDDADRLRARFTPTLDVLGKQDTDSGVWHPAPAAPHHHDCRRACG
ncbi:hypothetical protein [Micromonospora sp. NPDC050695]|uniref:hypothetical protein n=1 Tax=Micromonospora sp. NPDC050695 TaxID=3154938 RepID=UPI0033CBD059